MRNMTSAATQAIGSHTPKLAKRYRVKPSVMYAKLDSHNNVFDKTLKLIREIAGVNLPGVLYMKAQLDALFSKVLGQGYSVTTSDLHRDAFEAIQAELDGADRATRLWALRRLIASVTAKIREIDPDCQLVFVEHKHIGVAG